MRSVLYLIVLFIIATGAIHAQPVQADLDYGLAFASHETSKDHRTGLDLNPESPYSFNKDFTVQFDFSLQRLTNAYGYILRIIANDSVNIDLMSTPEHEEFHDLTLVVNNKPTSLQYEFSEVGLRPSLWTTLAVSFSFKDEAITLSWNGKSKTQSIPLKNLRSFRFYFGVNEFGKFNTTDAPPMMLRNITLSEKQKTTRKWLLKNHRINQVYDSIDNAVALVKNPIWLIDRHTQWTSRKSFVTQRFPSLAFNSDSSLMYITDEKNIYIYDLTKERLTSRTVQGSPVHTDANQLLYIKEKHALVNYDIVTEKAFAFDFSKNLWSNTDTTYHEPNYWHNNKFYNAEDQALYSFGGYGHFTYHNAFRRYDNASQKWTAVKTSGTIPPRYLAASGIRASAKQALIFGGYGSLSGKQELSPQSFYDLYSFDLKTHEVQKIRDYPAPQNNEDIVFSNSLVVNEDEQCFYVLSFPKNKYEGQINLRRYALDSDESVALADSIPFHFHDEDSFCDLFLSNATHELVAVTVHQVKQHYEVEVYTIAYPPLRTEDVLQPSQPGYARAMLAIFLILLIGGGVTAIVLYRKKRKQKITTPVTTESVPTAPTPTSVPVLHEEPRLSSAILLFGGFQVFDKSGNDMSSRFTMTLKELFALIVLHSVKFEKGISTTVLQEYLWPDKDEVSARNNRNVNIKKLRTLLEEIGTITIENNNSYLKLTMADDIFCDYQIVSRILHQDKAVLMQDPGMMRMLINSVKRGSLLPNLQVPWLDSFKSDISNQVIDILLEYCQKLDVGTDDKMLLEIADIIFTYDTINQEALVIKCSVLNKKGKYSLAKTWYDHFVKEYKNLYAENYPRTFEEVIS